VWSGRRLGKNPGPFMRCRRFARQNHEFFPSSTGEKTTVSWFPRRSPKFQMGRNTNLAKKSTGKLFPPPSNFRVPYPPKPRTLCKFSCLTRAKIGNLTVHDDNHPTGLIQFLEASFTLKLNCISCGCWSVTERELSLRGLALRIPFRISLGGGLVNPPFFWKLHRQTSSSGPRGWCFPDDGPQLPFIDCFHVFCPGV